MESHRFSVAAIVVLAVLLRQQLEHLLRDFGLQRDPHHTVDGATVGDREVRGDLGPGPDPHAVGLGERFAAVQRLRMGLAIGPDTFLESPRELGTMRLADEIQSSATEVKACWEAYMAHVKEHGC